MEQPISADEDFLPQRNLIKLCRFPSLRRYVCGIFFYYSDPVLPFSGFFLKSGNGQQGRCLSTPASCPVLRSARLEGLRPFHAYNTDPIRFSVSLGSPSSEAGGKKDSGLNGPGPFNQHLNDHD
jgi:hypothetical protein